MSTQYSISTLYVYHEQEREREREREGETDRQTERQFSRRNLLKALKKHLNSCNTDISTLYMYLKSGYFLMTTIENS